MTSRAAVGLALIGAAACAHPEARGAWLERDARGGERHATAARGDEAALRRRASTPRT